MYSTKERFLSRFELPLNQGRLACLFLVFYLLHFSAISQDNFQEGYVVLNNHDTLYGAIKDRKPHPFGRLYKKIKFKGKKGKSKYAPDEILAYKKGGTIYESVWISTSGGLFNTTYTSSPGQGEIKFLRVMAKGRVTYYHMEFEDADSGFIDAIPLFKKNGSTAMERVTQGIFGLRKKRLAVYFQDCPSLVEKILNEAVKDPYTIVQLYDNCSIDN